MTRKESGKQVMETVPTGATLAPRPPRQTQPILQTGFMHLLGIHREHWARWASGRGTHLQANPTTWQKVAGAEEGTVLPTGGRGRCARGQPWSCPSWEDRRDESENFRQPNNLRKCSEVRHGTGAGNP